MYSILTTSKLPFASVILSRNHSELYRTASGKALCMNHRIGLDFVCSFVTTYYYNETIGFLTRWELAINFLNIEHLI